MDASPGSPASNAPTAPSSPLSAVPDPPKPWFVRHMVIMGILLASFDLVALVILFLVNRGQVVPVLSSMGALFIVGKEGAIPTGVFSLGGDAKLIGFFLWLTDIAVIAMMYPLVQAALDGAQKTKFLGASLRAAHRRASKNRKLVDKFGPIGLYLFLIIPFAFNSPVVGMVLGRVAGIPPGRTVWAILGAITTTSLGWTLICIFVGRTVPPRYSWVPFVLSLTVTVTVLTIGYIDGVKQRRLEAAAKP